MLERILQEAAALPKVPKETAQAFQEKIPVMEEWVNREMESYPGISQIIGYNPLSTMFNNHHNHARLWPMSSGSMPLISWPGWWSGFTGPITLMAFSFDYFPMELCAWQKSVAAHLEVPQSQFINAIYQWMLDRHQDMVQLSQEPVHERLLQMESTIVGQISQLNQEVTNITRELQQKNQALLEAMEAQCRSEAAKEELIGRLQDALQQVKTLSGLLPICSSCKKIRNDKGYWQQLEGYIREHSEAEFTHSICPECMEKLYGDFLKNKTR
jgi:hypothetical protein